MSNVGNSHIEQLCQEHGIRWVRAPRAVDSKALPTARVVMFATFTDPLSYYAALHEIGHVMLHCGLPKEDAQLITREAEAWVWALDNALDDPPPTARRFIALALLSYLDCPELNRHKEQLDSPPVRTMLSRLQRVLADLDQEGEETGLDSFVWPR